MLLKILRRFSRSHSRGGNGTQVRKSEKSGHADMHFKSTQIANGNEEKEDRPFKIIINFIQASSDSLTAYQFIVAASFSPIMIVGGMAL